MDFKEGKIMKKKDKRHNLKDLIASNPYVDADVVVKARAEIRKLRKSGFGNKTYDINDRRMCSPLTSKRPEIVEKVPVY